MQTRSIRVASNEWEEQVAAVVDASAATMNGRHASQARTEGTNGRHLAKWTYGDADFIRTGQQLYRFAQQKHYHLRSVRSGRQCLARFIQQHQPSKTVKFPAEWTKNTTAVNRLLEDWMKVPGNPFNPSDGEERSYGTQRRKGRNAIDTFVEEDTQTDMSENEESVQSEYEATDTEQTTVAAHRTTGTATGRRPGQTKKKAALAAAKAAALAAAAAAAAKRAAEEALKAAAAAAAAAAEGDDGDEDDDEGREGGGTGDCKKAQSFTRFYTVVCSIASAEAAANTKDREDEVSWVSLGLERLPENGKEQHQTGGGRAARCESIAGTESTDYGDVAELDEVWCEEVCRTSEERAARRVSDAGTEDTDYGDVAELDELLRSDAFNEMQWRT